MIFVIQALNSRMTGTAGAAPASEMQPNARTPCIQNENRIRQGEQEKDRNDFEVRRAEQRSQ
jgi:hypothetical protein